MCDIYTFPVRSNLFRIETEQTLEHISNRSTSRKNDVESIVKDGVNVQSDENQVPDENAMDVDGSHLSGRSSQNMSSQGSRAMSINDDRYDVVVVSSVGLHVEGPIPFINPEIPVEQHAIVQIESNDVESISGDTDQISPTASVASSRAPSPVDLPEESNQSECIGVENDEKESRKRSLSEDDDDGRICPICLDNWTNTGDHRICALKCGHLFGYKCVNRWLESQQKKSCPTCKKRVNRSDLRYIYAKKLIAVDTSQLEEMKRHLEIAKEEKNKILMDISRYACREQLLNQEISHLKKQIEELTNNRESNSSSSGSSSFTPFKPPVVRLFMDKSLEICRQGGCRVFDANCQLDLIMTSMRSPNGLFSGFGIRKVNISYYKPLAFTPLHTLQIRDICFHPVNNWVLTASMDKSFKVVDTVSNSIMYTTSQQMPLWSCCWDVDNQYILYIGTQSGVVVKYDIRSLHQPLCTLAVAGDMSPVVSVASIPSRYTDLEHGGVISCKLNSLWVFENSGNDHIRHSLSLEGPFVSMKYQAETRQLLVSSRPNNRISYSRHTLCTLEKASPDKINCNIIHSFQGGGMQKLLSKSCFLSDNQEYVAAHHESNKSVYLWSINTGQRVCSVPAHDAVLDLRGIQNQNGNYLVSLTEKKMEFFKFN